jgi:hypothetical protein
MASNFELDPDKPGWQLGWAVFRKDPWHVAGFFDSQAEAHVCAGTLSGYKTAYGSNKAGTEDFIKL